MRAAYTEEKMLYKDGICGIKGKINDRDELLNVTGLLNSSLYAYLNLMLGSSIGIEREQRFMDEIDKFPYIYDINIAEKVEQIQEEKQKDKLTNVTNEDEMIEELDNIILQKFNLENNEFIDYALNIQIPLINSRKNMMTRTVTPEEM